MWQRCRHRHRHRAEWRRLHLPDSSAAASQLLSFSPQRSALPPPPVNLHPLASPQAAILSAIVAAGHDVLLSEPDVVRLALAQMPSVCARAL